MLFTVIIAKLFIISVCFILAAHKVEDIHAN